MGLVIIKCPNTGLAVSTGIETESEILRGLPRIAAPMACAACGQVHAWTKDDAWLAEEIPLAGPAEPGSEAA